MYKILQRDFRKLTPPVMATQYIPDRIYDNFESFPVIYYTLEGKYCSECFPILFPEIGGGYRSMIKGICDLPLNTSVAISDLETTSDVWTDAEDDINIFIVYEPEDIKCMIEKLEGLL